jgi:hypothetical protein
LKTLITILTVSLAATLPSFAQPNPERNAYFGETHIHTSWSVDAWVMGNRITGPGDAYKYAQGETIKHPMGFDIRIDTPLDFMGVTDHSEYVGVTREANTPGSYVSKLPEAQPMIMKDPNSKEEQNRVFSYLLKLNSGAPVKALMDPKITSTVWKENVKIANEANQPGRFTAFCSYEWTSMPGGHNLHRNVFFRACDKVPDYPFSSLESTRPTDLWNWMDAQRKSGNELLAISHNANVSDGWMYPVDIDNTTGRPIDAAWAAARDRNERLVEIKQGKGQSETHPLLSPNDEFASYELFQAILGLPDGVGRVDHITGSFARQALKDGLTMQDVRGYNPYKFGMAGGSDSHNSAAPYRHDNFFGLHVDADGTVHFTNVPQDSRFKVYLKERKTPDAVTDTLSSEIRHYDEKERARYAKPIREAARATRLEPALIHAVISAESGYNPFARSPKGAAKERKIDHRNDPTRHAQRHGVAQQ